RPGGARSATGASAERATRRERVLEVVAVEPGISVREIVAQLGVNRTSLYPVVRALMSDGLLHKDGRGLWLASR
ncbi:MAG TPA: helix-turn-helix domain-containing protein, partial [Solirubrobacteraceae bacterium]|nr:helix-turn-helix domain-containing protein [Solirubrobacteraceae bacterium]